MWYTVFCNRYESNGRTTASVGIPATTTTFPNCTCRTTSFGSLNSYYTSVWRSCDPVAWYLIADFVFSALDPAASKISEPKMSVDNDGNVMWRPKFDVKTKCDIDLKSWPWDQHQCILQFSSCSHKIPNVIYKINEVRQPVSISSRVCVCVYAMYVRPPVWPTTCTRVYSSKLTAGICCMMCTLLNVSVMLPSSSLGLETWHNEHNRSTGQHSVEQRYGIYQQWR